MTEEFKAKYFAEFDIQKRKAMLDEANLSEEEREILLELFQARYADEDKEIDLFLRGILELKFNEKGSRSKKKKANEIKGVLKLWHVDQIGQRGKIQDDIIYQELCHTLRRYISVSISDRSYTSSLWGLKKMDDADIPVKMAKDLGNFLFQLPAQMEMQDEFAIPQMAAREVFKEFYPDRADELEEKYFAM